MMYGKFVILDIVPVEVLLDNMHDSYLPTFVMRALGVILKHTHLATLAGVELHDIGCTKYRYKLLNSCTARILSYVTY